MASKNGAAFHEAGHVVVALALGGGVSYALIEPAPGASPGEWIGHVRQAVPALSDENQLAVYKAGGIAEGLSGMSSPGSTGGDEANAQLLTTDPADHSRAEALARSLVDANHPAIGTVARGLLSAPAGRLSGHEIGSLVTAPGRPTIPKATTPVTFDADDRELWGRRQALAWRARHKGRTVLEAHQHDEHEKRIAARDALRKRQDREWAEADAREWPQVIATLASLERSDPAVADNYRREMLSSARWSDRMRVYLEAQTRAEAAAHRAAVVRRRAVVTA